MTRSYIEIKSSDITRKSFKSIELEMVPVAESHGVIDRIIIKLILAIP